MLIRLAASLHQLQMHHLKQVQEQQPDFHQPEMQKSDLEEPELHSKVQYPEFDHSQVQGQYSCLEVEALESLHPKIQEPYLLYSI